MDRYDVQADSLAREAERNANGAKRIENATLQAVNTVSSVINSINSHIAKQQSNEYTRGFEGDFKKKVFEGYFSSNVDADGNIEYLTPEQSEAKYDQWVTEYQTSHPIPKNILARQTIDEYFKGIRNDNIDKTRVSSIQGGQKIQSDLEEQFLKGIVAEDIDGSGNLVEYHDDVMRGFPAADMMPFETELEKENTSTSLKMLNYAKYLRQNTNLKPYEIKSRVEASRDMFAKEDFVNRFSRAYKFDINDPNDSEFWNDVEKALKGNVVFFGRNLRTEEKSVLRASITQNVASAKSAAKQKNTENWNNFVSEVAAYENNGGYVTDTYITGALSRNGLDPETDVTQAEWIKINNISDSNKNAMMIESCGKQLMDILNSDSEGSDKIGNIITLLDSQPLSVRNVIEANMKAISVNGDKYYVPFREMAMNQREEHSGNDIKYALSGNFQLGSLIEPTTNSQQAFEYATLESQIDLFNDKQEFAPELRKKIDSMMADDPDLTEANAIYLLQEEITSYKNLAFNEKTVDKELYNEWVSNYTDAAKRAETAEKMAEAAEATSIANQDRDNMRAFAQLEAEVEIYHKDEAHAILPNLQSEIDKLRVEYPNISDDDAIQIISDSKIVDYKTRAITDNKTISSERYNEVKDSIVKGYDTSKDKFLNDPYVQQDILGFAMLGVPEAVSAGTLTQSVANAKAQWEANLSMEDMAAIAKNADTKSNATRKETIAMVSIDGSVVEQEIDVKNQAAIDESKDEAFKQYMVDNIQNANYIMDNYGNYKLNNGKTYNANMDMLMKNEAHSKMQEVSTYYVPDAEADSENNQKAKDEFQRLCGVATSCKTKTDRDQLRIYLNTESAKKTLYEDDYNFIMDIVNEDYMGLAESKGVDVEKAIMNGLGVFGDVNGIISNTSGIDELRPVILKSCASSILSTSMDAAAISKEISETTEAFYRNYKITESLELGDEKSWKELEDSGSKDIQKYIFKEDHEKHLFRHDGEKRPQAYDQFAKGNINPVTYEGVLSLFNDPEINTTIQSMITGGHTSDKDINKMLVGIALGDEDNTLSLTLSDDDFWEKAWTTMANDMNGVQRNVMSDILNTSKGIIKAIQGMKGSFPELDYSKIAINGNNVVIGGDQFRITSDHIYYMQQGVTPIDITSVAKSGLSDKTTKLTAAAANYTLGTVWAEGGNTKIKDAVSRSVDLASDEYYDTLDSYLESYMASEFGEGFNNAVSAYEALTGKKLVVKSSKGRNNAVSVKLSFK